MLQEGFEQGEKGAWFTNAPEEPSSGTLVSDIELLQRNIGCLPACPYQGQPMQARGSARELFSDFPFGVSNCGLLISVGYRHLSGDMERSMLMDEVSFTDGRNPDEAFLLGYLRHVDHRPKCSKSKPLRA